jgi:hypothetical protein
MCARSKTVKECAPGMEKKEELHETKITNPL